MAKIKLAVGPILLMSLLGLSTPAIADQNTVRWSEVNIPTEGESGNWVLANGSDVQHLTMATDGTLYCYANPSGTSYTLFKSTDGGYSWSYAGKVEDTIVDIAAAPDDASVIYYATMSDVYKSTDAGSSFTRLLPNPGGAGTDNLTITSIDVARLSPPEAAIIAVGTRDTDSSQYGGVYILDEEQVVPSWVDTNLVGYDVYAVGFSPNFAADRQLVAVVTNEANTFVTTRIGDAGWGVTIGDATIENLVPASACVAFPGDYGATTEEYVLFVAIDAGSDSGDVYMINRIAAPRSSVATDLNIGSVYGLSDVDVTTLAISGNVTTANILAGAASTNRVYFSTDGGIKWRRSTKEPTGQSKTYVVMAADFTSSGRAYTATSGTESAFSMTQDGGVSWNQVSLIDTKITNIVDRVASPNFIHDNTLFMLTFDGEYSLWRSLNGGTRWERVFTSGLANVDSIKLVELSPQYGDSSQVVFLAGTSNGDPAIWKSMDNGQNFVRRITYDRTTGTSFNINVWAVVNDNTLFVGSFDGTNGLLYHSANSGWTYSTGAIVGKKSLNSIVLSPDYEQDKTILVGNSEGWVYWSNDNGVSFEPLPPDTTSPPLTRSITIAFDPEFSSNKTVYVATPTAVRYKDIHKGIYRFVINKSTEWAYTLATTAPTLVRPTQDFSVKFNPVTGRAAQVTFTWERPSDEVTKYDLWIAFDNVFDVVLKAITVEETGTPVSVVVGPEADTLLEFMPDTTYFWKVRISSDAPFKCQWSETRSFTVAEIPKALPPVEIVIPPAPPAPEITITPPPVVVELPPTPAPITPAYIWAIIIIGAVLVIALTVLTSLNYKATPPQLQSPKAGASGLRLKPLFQWSAVAGADSYELLVSTDASFSNPVIIKTGAYALPSTAWQCDIGLNYNTTYYWKVRAISSDTWSAVGAFTTKPLPSLSSPPPGHRPQRHANHASLGKVSDWWSAPDHNTAANYHAGAGNRNKAALDILSISIIKQKDLHAGRQA